jgi:hypothetical protein
MQLAVAVTQPAVVVTQTGRVVMHIPVVVTHEEVRAVQPGVAVTQTAEVVTHIPAAVAHAEVCVARPATAVTRSGVAMTQPTMGMIQTRVGDSAQRPTLPGPTLLQGRTCTIVLDSKDNERKILRSGSLDRFDGVRISRDPIGEEDGETVRRRHDHADIDLASNDLIPQMHDVDDQKVATARDLDLDSQANPSAVHRMAFRPIHTARGSGCPSLGDTKALVEDGTNLRRPVGVTPFLHEELEAHDDSFQLRPEGLQSEPGDTLHGAVERLPVCDLWH